MNTVIIDKKKYVLLEQKEYEVLQLQAASKTVPAKKLSLKAGRKLANNLIDKWAKEK